MDAQADLSLRWAQSHFVGFVMRRLISAVFKSCQDDSKVDMKRPSCNNPFMPTGLFYPSKLDCLGFLFNLSLSVIT